MKKLHSAARQTISLVVLILAISAQTVFAQNSGEFSVNTSPLPRPTGHVNDYAGVIDAATKQALETKLQKFQTDTGVELAVAVVKTTGERAIFDYSLAVARGWGIGSKSDDNPSGLLLIAIEDRKYYTQISKDLEDELPDGITGSIQRQFLVPEFRKGNYAKGIADTLGAYISTIESQRSGVEPKPTPAQTEGGSGSESLFALFCCLVVFGLLIVIILANRGGGGGGGGKSGKDRDRWGGGFGGGALPWIVVGGSNWGGGSSSGDWGGSSGGWGGFGGGGDFGGGGAGGDW